MDRIHLTFRQGGRGQMNQRDKILEKDFQFQNINSRNLAVDQGIWRTILDSL